MNKLTALIAVAFLGLTLGAGNAAPPSNSNSAPANEGVAIVKCQEKVNLGEAGRDVPPQVFQFQASAGVAQPGSCIPLPGARPFVDGGRSCAQCLSDLIFDGEDCGLAESPVVVLQADPGRFEFRSVEKYTLVCRRSSKPF